jgi:predicted DNA-binding transcriptional regulator YafY
MARLEAIRALISEGKYPNSHTIARELEWSVRTVKRDLSLMQNRLNLPMEFDSQKNGWYFTKPVPFFPSIPLTEKEVVGLFVAQKSIEQYKGTALEPVLNGAFRKMMAGLDDAVKYSLGNLDEVVSIRPLAPGDADMEKFQSFTRAIREKRIVRFVYRKHGKVTTGVKVVHPYHVAYVNNLWTLFAFDPTVLPARGNVVRKFVFFRVTGLELTGEKFAVSTRLDLNKELEGSMGVFKGTEKHEVVIEFDAWGADDVRARTWHASQELVDRPDGTLLVKMTLNNLEEVERWVLGFGEHATVVEPAELKERVAKAATAIQRKYAAADRR